ncbi:hypothetical protein BDZ85DRAFT_258114 [Elsinoe ampelina]|uniref:Uncharacterized protein n=1 Tax=Elsinoe ampelina TaxID=302913 RepID=A0A6A6GJ79_9PEZI|nr:hypothetical protein BDZ85DRAFT_258114 [Elsinoe ampelina]
MKSFIASAVLGAAALANAATIPHGHAHTHVKRSPIQFMSLADVARLDSVEGFGGENAGPSSVLTAASVKIGANLAAAANPDAPITVGGDGPFKVEFINESEDDIIVVAWSDVGMSNPWDAAIVTKTQPAVTHTLQANTSTVVSFDPTKAGGKLSGAWTAIYPDTILNNGFIFEAWGEYTFTDMSVFSTTDVSRATNMNGHKMAIHNFANEGDAVPACSSTWDKCSFVCPEGQQFCQYGVNIQNCPVGTPGTTSSSDYQHGGCAGMRNNGGYMRAHFF